MFAISNAMLSQAEVEDTKHWNHGPLEFAFIDLDKKPQMDRAACIGVTAQWNGSYEGGYLRSASIFGSLEEHVPGVIETKNPNMFIAPRECGFSALEVMLASVLPAQVLHAYGLKKERCNLWLASFGHHEMAPGYGRKSRKAFEKYIWSKIQRSSRHRFEFFSADSPLRLLAADSQYWMSRLFRVALTRYESKALTNHVDRGWKPMEAIEREFSEYIADQDTAQVHIRRPRLGGQIWDPEDEAECEQVIDEMLDGLGVMEPIEPLLDVLYSMKASEDFSDRYSWIKDDFERSFYSKRAKFRVKLVETMDEFPAWEAGSKLGHEDMIFRDVLSLFNRRDQTLLIALRHGRSVSEVSAEMDYASHSTLSRRLSVIKKRVESLLSG